MKIKKRQIVRKEIKSSEGEFLYELAHSYELSPKLSSMILLSAKECLFREYQLREGEIEVRVISVEERAGKVIEKLEKRRVKLTISNGQEDEEVYQSFGRIVLRQIKIQRITGEAIEQGGVLSQEDLSKYLSCTVRTIQRDIKALKARGEIVLTRGYLHNIGRGQTHKAKIIGMYLDGLTYSEIKQKSRHSIGAIKRYLESFIKVVMSINRGIYHYKEISLVTGLSATLVKQYAQLLKESKKDKLRKANLSMLITRSSYREAVKKRVSEFSKSGAAMTGGLL
jgi:DNA-binding transcriptional regulator YhcF (GntR family)